MDRRAESKIISRPAADQLIIRAAAAIFKCTAHVHGRALRSICGARNAYGTVRWRCFVCETVGPGEEAERVPFVTPAARVLLHTQGAAQSRLFLKWLAGFAEEAIDPPKCPADLFLACRALDRSRIGDAYLRGRPPRPMARHRAEARESTTTLSNVWRVVGYSRRPLLKAIAPIVPLIRILKTSDTYIGLWSAMSVWK